MADNELPEDELPEDESAAAEATESGSPATVSGVFRPRSAKFASGSTNQSLAVSARLGLQWRNDQPTGACRILYFNLYVTNGEAPKSRDRRACPKLIPAERSMLFR